MMSSLFRVLYCSRNRASGMPRVIEADINHILVTSRRNNARDRITGSLLFSEGCFAQVLEGSREAVEKTFERIQNDERHSDVVVLQVGPLKERDFPAWSMAFVGSAQGGTLLGGPILADALSRHSSAGAEILTMLKSVVVRETEWLALAPQAAHPNSDDVDDVLVGQDLSARAPGAALAGRGV